MQFHEFNFPWEKKKRQKKNVHNETNDSLCAYKKQTIQTVSLYKTYSPNTYTPKSIDSKTGKYKLTKTKFTSH